TVYDIGALDWGRPPINDIYGRKPFETYDTARHNSLLVSKEDNIEKIRTTVPTEKIHKSNIEESINQDQILGNNNTQIKLLKNPSKRSLPLSLTNGLCENESIEEEGLERKYDITIGDSIRTLLVERNDIEEHGDDTGSEDSRSGDGINRISEGLGSDSGTTNRRYFSLTSRMEQGTEEVDMQQEGDGSHIFRTISLRIIIQRTADQCDPHQVRQPYRSIRFSKTKSRINISSGSEENSQVMSTTENTNTDSTYSGNIEQDNGRTKQVKHLGRLFSKERDIHSPVLSVADNTNAGLVRNRGKQTHGQIRGKRRGRGRGRVVERIFQTMEGGDLLDPPTNSEDWKSPDRLGEVQTQVSHGSTLVARSNMVHVFTNRQQQIPYSWRELSDSEPGEGDDQEDGHVTTRKNRGIPHGPRVDQARK
ncbi:MAG: hypothetical protein EZS28_001805, partial [Streblomastix strix]